MMYEYMKQALPGILGRSDQMAFHEVFGRQGRHADQTICPADKPESMASDVAAALRLCLENGPASTFSAK
jgi:hypothetical protein